MVVFRNMIYKALNVFEEEMSKYDHYLCCFSGDFSIVDCFPCTKYGKIHPGYNHIGSPVNTSNLGDPIAKVGHNGEVQQLADV